MTTSFSDFGDSQPGINMDCFMICIIQLTEFVHNSDCVFVIYCEAKSETGQNNRKIKMCVTIHPYKVYTL